MIETSRMRLIPSTEVLAVAEIGDRTAFAALLGADVPDNWPPDMAADVLPWFLDQLRADPENAGWLAWYGLALDIGERPVLVMGAGFKGKPISGIVETGYSVLPQFYRRGYATEMVGALVNHALAQPDVQRVLADTTPDNAGSLGILAKLGFTEVGPGSEAGSLLFEKRARRDT